MSIAKSYSAHLVGLMTEIITVEVDISNGLNAVSIVGLGDRAVEEAKDRVSAAIKNSGFTSPKQKNQKVVISLAPADVRKEGPAFDMAIAIAYLQAAGDVACNLEKSLFLGELSLEGNIRKVVGVLPIICQARTAGFERVFIPAENASEASLATDIDTFPINSLGELIEFLSGSCRIDPIEPADMKTRTDETLIDGIDMRLIRGNDSSKRALEIAAAGMHNILMYGPPGTGKTMLARSFSTILPHLTREEAVEVTSIHSAARSLGTTLMYTPPFRSPHHTASYAAVVGGGTIPRPGEITLAHRGVLFLDEFPEFDRSVLEALRQPLEDRSITVSRAKGSMTFPAHCILVASMNPCPCGKRQTGGCTCRQGELRAYERKISGPILDRIDIWLNVQKVDYDQLASRKNKNETSAAMRERIMHTRAIQARRFAAHGIAKQFNSEMDADDINKLVIMSPQARARLKKLAKEHGLSGRAFHRVIKVAQTIVDVTGDTFIKQAHILEALQYRQKTDLFTYTAPDQRTDSGHRGFQSEREGLL